MMKKLWIALLAAAGMMLSGSLTASAAESSLMDVGNYLSESEQQELDEVFADVTYYTGMNVGVYLDDTSVPEEAVEETMEAMYLAAFGSDTDGVYCYVKPENDTMTFYLYTSGSASQYYADTDGETRLTTMTEDFWFYLDPSGNNSMFEAVQMLLVDLEYYYFEGPLQNSASADTETAPSENGTTAEETAETKDISDLSSAEYPGTAVLFDEGGKLSGAEYQQCLAVLQDAADVTGMNVGVILGVKSRSEYTIESLAVESYDELFGERTDGLLYYMDLCGYEPYDYITTCGMGQFYYSDGSMDNRIDEIFDKVTPYLYPVGSEDVVGAIGEFAESVEYYYELGITDHYYLYDELDECYYYVEDGKMQQSFVKPYVDMESVFMMGCFGLFIGFGAALITFFVVKHRYKFKSECSPTTYVNRKNLVFHANTDEFIRTYTTRVKIESSSSGGGGGRSGGGRSRGGHGGGGRRR